MGLRVLVTGAAGFIGGATFLDLSRRGYDVLGTVRSTSGSASVQDRLLVSPRSAPEWKAILDGVDVVIHAAGRAHILRETEADPLAAFRQVNTAGTLELAEQASIAGVRRFICLSSIGVLGNQTPEGMPFDEHSPPAPYNPYTLSKLEAEQGLRDIAGRTGLDITILRPPLVYGPGVKANFRRLMRYIETGLPLPLGAVRNQRSFLFLGNLLDVIRLCIDHPSASGETFVVDDGQPISTPDLIRQIAHAMNRPPRLIPVPEPLLRWAARAAGAEEALGQLSRSCVIDSSYLRRTLAWAPRFTLEQGLRLTMSGNPI